MAPSLHRLAGLLIGPLLFVSCSDRDGDPIGSGADTYPARPIKVIVPFAPGGGSDTFARALQTAIKEENLLPQPLTIINRGGAGGTIGSRSAKDAEPDGYTLLFLHDAIVTARYAGQVEFGPAAFEPVAVTGELGAVIAVGPESEFETLDQLMAAAGREPETISFAANIGAPSHFWALLLERASPQDGARFRFVQSGGGADRFGDLKGGHVAVSAFSVAELLQFESEGLRALAFLGAERHPALPEVPTAWEQGYEVDTGNLQSWWAPRGTPQDRIDVVATALQAAMQSPTMIERLEEWQIEPRFLQGKAMRAEIARREAEIREAAPADLGDALAAHLPNLPLWNLIAVLGLAVAVAVAAWIKRRHYPPAEPANEEERTEAPSPSPTPKAKAAFPWQALWLALAIVMIVGFWQLGSLGFRTMATLLIVVTGFQLKQRISGFDLLVLGIGGAALAVGGHWLFTAVLGVDL